LVITETQIKWQTIYEEVLKRKEEIDQKHIRPYLKVLLNKVALLGLQGDTKKKAEDVLMYSTLFQNAALAT
jgi:hypothetical protein